MTIKYGCHTYSWQMSFDKYSEKLPDILTTMNQSGFEGAEPDISILGPYEEEPSQLKKKLNDLNMDLSALNIEVKWDELDRPMDNEKFQYTINYLKNFPGSLMVFLNWTNYNRENMSDSEILRLQKDNIKNLNYAAKIASEKGIQCVFHPNSAPNSLFRNQNDYDIMFNEIDGRYLGFAPDTGHIVNGKMDVMDVFKNARNLIKHVHFKDISNDYTFASMGEGMIDHLEIVSFLQKTKYSGWIVVEDESPLAEKDPFKATSHSGEYIKKNFM